MMESVCYENRGQFAAERGISFKRNSMISVCDFSTRAMQVEADQVPYPQLVPMYRYYLRMANWYKRSGNKEKALEAGQKAITEFRKDSEFSETKLKEMEVIFLREDGGR